MKIKQEFWNLIVQDKKQVVLRKTSERHEINYLAGCGASENEKKGRLQIKVYADNFGDDNIFMQCYLGTITINGYEIITKEQYNKWFDLTKEYLYENEYSHIKHYDVTTYELFTALIDEDITIPYWFVNNFEWIYEHNKWIDDYFKNEKELLVLKIESWEDNDQKI